MARLVRSLEVLRAQVDTRWPQRSKASDGWIGDAAHQGRKSDHNPEADGTVDALDITHDPAGGCDCGRIAAAIRASRDPRVDYIIFNRQICSSSVEPWKWRPYNGSNPHTTHMHISVLDGRQDDISPWSIEDTMEPLFERKAPGIMRAIIRPLQIGTEDAAAILGNAGHESDGFKAHFQYEGGPARGMWQWEGSRRTLFEQKCRQWRPDDPDYIFSDEANVRFLIYELTNTSEKRVVPRLRAAPTLRAKTEVFCDVFERPSVKAYDNRVRYAERALKAFSETSPQQLPAPSPPQPTEPTDGTVTPDGLLEGVRPQTIVVRDRLTSQIEGFPRGVVETTYVRHSVRFVPDQSSPAVPGLSTQTSKGLGNMFINTIARILLKSLGFLDGKKTASGIVGLLIGAALYAATQLGFTPTEPSDTLKQIIDYAIAVFTNGGGALALYGIGDRSGKIKGGIAD